jgi:outer membrane lipoprotein SlyB
MAARIHTALAIALLVGELGLAGPTLAQAPQRSEAECSQQATQQTGFDPMNPPVPAQANAAGATGSGARVKGAAVGATIGAVSGGDAGDAAVAGAVAGGVAKRSSNRRAARAQNEAKSQAVAAGHAAYEQARANCLAGH